MKLAVMGVLGLSIFLCGGCQSETLLLEKQFVGFKVGQSTAADVLSVLPEDGIMHTASAVSAYDHHYWTTEVGIVQFSPTDSTVLRTDYVQRRSQHWVLLTHEKIMLWLQTVVPDDVLNVPYENDMRKYETILRYCHSAMIRDAQPFTEDKPTESLIGMGRTALGIGILKLTEQPRDAQDILSEDGFVFVHDTLGKCRLFLRQDEGNVFSVVVRGSSWVDMFMTW